MRSGAKGTHLIYSLQTYLYLLIYLDLKNALSRKISRDSSEFKQISDRFERYKKLIPRLMNPGICVGLSRTHAIKQHMGQLQQLEADEASIEVWTNHIKAKSIKELINLLNDKLHQRPAFLTEQKDDKELKSTFLKMLNYIEQTQPGFARVTELGQDYHALPFNILDENGRIKNATQIAGHFEAENLEVLFDEVIFENNICLLKSRDPKINHAVRVAHINGNWLVYDSNYHPDELDLSSSPCRTCKIFHAKKDAAYEVTRILGNSLIVEASSLSKKDQQPKVLAFPGFQTLIDTQPLNLIKEHGLVFLAIYNADKLSEIFRNIQNLKLGGQADIANALIKQIDAPDGGRMVLGLEVLLDTEQHELLIRLLNYLAQADKDSKEIENIFLEILTIHNGEIFFKMLHEFEGSFKNEFSKALVAVLDRVAKSDAFKDASAQLLFGFKVEPTQEVKLVQKFREKETLPGIGQEQFLTEFFNCTLEHIFSSKEAPEKILSRLEKAESLLSSGDTYDWRTQLTEISTQLLPRITLPQSLTFELKHEEKRPPTQMHYLLEWYPEIFQRLVNSAYSLDQKPTPTMADALATALAETNPDVVSNHIKDSSVFQQLLHTIHLYKGDELRPKLLKTLEVVLQNANFSNKWTDSCNAIFNIQPVFQSFFTSVTPRDKQYKKLFSLFLQGASAESIVKALAFKSGNQTGRQIVKQNHCVDIVIVAFKNAIKNLPESELNKLLAQIQNKNHNVYKGLYERSPRIFMLFKTSENSITRAFVNAIQQQKDSLLGQQFEKKNTDFSGRGA